MYAERGRIQIKTVITLKVRSVTRLGDKQRQSVRQAYTHTDTKD